MSSQQGPKAAPGQHSAHILLGFILREPHSTSANFLGNVGEGSAGWARRACPGVQFCAYLLCAICCYLAPSHDLTEVRPALDPL